MRICLDNALPTQLLSGHEETKMSNMQARIHAETKVAKILFYGLPMGIVEST